MKAHIAGYLAKIFKVIGTKNAAIYRKAELGFKVRAFRTSLRCKFRNGSLRAEECVFQEVSNAGKFYKTMIGVDGCLL